jgi:hypothetical protein
MTIEVFRQEFNWVTHFLKPLSTNVRTWGCGH